MCSQLIQMDCAHCVHELCLPKIDMGVCPVPTCQGVNSLMQRFTWESDVTSMFSSYRETDING